MKILAFIETTVRDRHGKVISHHKKRSRSFVRGFNHMLCAQMRGESNPDPAIQTKDTGGALRWLRNASNCFLADAPAANITHGIRIGTDNTAVDIEDFALIAAIAEGGAGGQMNHGACSCTYVGVAGSQCSFTVQRIMTNNSGGQINVREAAIYNSFRDLSTTRYICSCRDLISEDVPDTAQITVTYTIRVVV